MTAPNLLDATGPARSGIGKRRFYAADAVEETMKNGRKAIKGKCPTCGVVMFKILGGKAAVATAGAAKTSTPSS
jgi:uncharacterized Zn finger protein (UPF0148 family)